ncbi:hypothetical protein ACLMJK_004284 [Lecanora helva]
MTAQTLGTLSRVFSCFTKLHLLLFILISAILILSFAPLPIDSKVGCDSSYPRRPHQAFISSKNAIVNALTGEPSANSSSRPEETSGLDLPEDEASEYKSGPIKAQSSPAPADEEEYLAICLLVKDDPLELREFFTHHYHHHGIRRFYIYDDGSNPALAEHLDIDSYNVPNDVLSFTYIDPSSVPDDDRPSLQDRTMERCIRDHGSKHHWMGLLDPDEYVEMRHAEFPLLLDWLKHWEEMDVGKDKDNNPLKGVGALAISWLPHSSNSLVEIPSTGFRSAYRECISGGRADYWTITHVKSFVRPQYVSIIPNIHSVIFHDDDNMTRYGEHMDDTRYEVSRQPPTHEYWALHHYATGSRKYFEQKASKGRSQGPGAWAVDEAYWSRYHDMVTTYKCDEMAAYKP